MLSYLWDGERNKMTHKETAKNLAKSGVPVTIVVMKPCKIKGKIHLEAKDIHPTIFGSTIDVGEKKNYKFDGGLMATLGMYDEETGDSIPGTLSFIPDKKKEKNEAKKSKQTKTT